MTGPALGRRGVENTADGPRRGEEVYGRAGEVTVLVLTEDLDPTADAVVDELRRRGVGVFRCDTAWFPIRLGLDAELDGDRWFGSLAGGSRACSLRHLRSAWYRRPTAFVLPEGLSGPERRHALWEAKLGLGGVLAALALRWVNHPSVEADASYKPVQLAVAARSGLAVPPTLVTNERSAVRRFFVAQQGQVVVKPLAYSAVFEDATVKALYTHPLAASDLADLTGVSSTAHLFQRAVLDKVFEARVTVVGDRIFAAAVHADSAAARADWRSDPDAVHWSTVEAPPAVRQGIMATMKGMGLRFGAFDFAVDTAGTWWFFEVNSSGQFGFVEDATGLPITAALADLLACDQA